MRLLSLRCGAIPWRRFWAAKMEASAAPNFVPVQESKGGEDAAAAEEEGANVRLVSYNVLAQAYVKSAAFPNSPSACLRWKARSRAVLSKLLSLDADLLCLQELDEYHSFYRDSMTSEGYDSVYVKRSGRKRDGCGIFFRRARFQLLGKQEIDYNRLVPDSAHSHVEREAQQDNPDDPAVRLKRDCVGIMAAFRFLDAPHQVMLLANTHLYWDPTWADVKLAQAKYLVSCLCDYAQVVSQQFKCAPLIVLAGDFNSQPGDQVYAALVSGVPCSDEHTSPLALHSFYAAAGGEPAFTNVSDGFTGTLDYILYHPSEALQPRRYLKLPSSKSASEIAGGLPNFSHPSDHLPIGADFVIKA